MSTCKSQGGFDSSFLSEQEKHLCDSLALDSNVIHLIREHYSNEIEPFHYSLGRMYKDGVETEIDPIRPPGLLLHEKNRNSYNLIYSLKNSLSKKGYLIFLVEENFGLEGKPDAIGILKGVDKYGVLNIMETNGANYDIDTDSLLTIIHRFDKEYELDLIGASGDYCEFQINKEPSSWLTMATEVYEICPDVVDQGTDTVEALADELRRTKRLYLWWD